MNLQLIGDNIDIDNRIKQVCEDRIGKELEKYLKDFADDLKVARIKIQKIKTGFNVNFDMRLPGSNGHIFSEESGDDLLNVLIALRREVERQIKDYKGKLQEYR